ncbi:hypothetical protein DWU98_18955 [Dyella monticola]|uniref:Jacalin-type lectin domain-containing protein n=1 Tax=Dyella monticola TaxID=1927958 RepID=A0A370WSX3_9GAMM|nr:hypothetical protein [Dyella monticola]RDS79232.1 hypothetical protein DWU98_18955 [Dyella monticola]
MKRTNVRYSRLQRKSALLLCVSALAFACGSAHAQTTGYTGIFGGGPLYKHVASNISEIENSGFTEVVVWSVEVSSAGDLNFNGEFPLTSGGTYVGNNTWPSFAADLVTMKQGTPKRITFSVGSSNVGDWQDIKALVNAQGTGPTSILYKDFQALKAALPSVDAVDFDDENSYDSASTVAFAVMLGSLGYHVEVDPYTNASYWTSVVSQINSQSPGTVDGVHLQTYSGGAGNSPCSGWNFGTVPVFPGVWDADDTPPQAQSQMSSWHSQCGITGGFLWLYDDIAGKTYNGGDETAAYANAINTGLAGGSTTTGVYGIYSDGTAFTTGGLDGNGYAYSANLLGSSQTWNGDTFSFGAPNTANALSGSTITLTQGQYSELSILGTGLNGSQAAQTFMVKYTDGSSTVVNQSLSDWFSPQNYPGESDAVTMAYRDTSTGSKDNRTFYLYGYAFPIDSTKTVQSVVLPNNRNVAVLSYALSNPTINAVPVSLTSAFNRTGIYTDGTTFSSTGGVDGVGDAYSAQLLGSSLEYNDVLYHFGSANAANDVSASGQTITLSSGEFSGLQLLAASVNGNQTSQTFTVTYTDGTQSTFTQSISDWFTPQSYAGELQAAVLPYRDTSSGGRDSRTFYLYNYKFNLNNAKTVQSIKLPNNASVQIMAMTLVQ